MGRVPLIDLEVTVHHETDEGSTESGAYLVSLDGVRKHAVWVPKKLCQLDENRGETTLTLREDIAAEKGLV